jgi:hypothetical protein
MIIKKRGAEAVLTDLASDIDGAIIDTQLKTSNPTVYDIWLFIYRNLEKKMSNEYGFSLDRGLFEFNNETDLTIKKEQIDKLVGFANNTYKGTVLGRENMIALLGDCDESYTDMDIRKGLARLITRTIDVYLEYPDFDKFIVL